MPPRVFSSVKEAWAGVLSGAVPITRRRVSCSNIDAPLGDSGGRVDSRVLPQVETQTTSDESNEEYDEDPFECRVFVQLSAEDTAREEVDVGGLSSEDLRRLKRDDPFLYYSIPSIRRRSYRFNGEDGDEADAVRMTSPLRRTSLPAHVLANADISRSQQEEARQEVEGPAIEEPRRRNSVVRRNRRLSTEAHPTLVCDELMRELQDLDIDDDDMDENVGLLESALGGI